MVCDNSKAINYRSARLGNDMAPVGRRPIDLQFTYRLVIPAVRRDRREAVFLFRACHFANVGYWHIASIRTHAVNGRFWRTKRTIQLHIRFSVAHFLEEPRPRCPRSGFFLFLVASVGGLVIGFLALTALRPQIPRYPTELRPEKFYETNHKLDITGRRGLDRRPIPGRRRFDWKPQLVWRLSEHLAFAGPQ